MEMLTSILFGAGALLVGTALLWLSLAPRVKPYLALREAFENWRRMLTAGPGQMQIFDFNPLGFRALVRHYHGSFWTATGCISGSAARIHVDPQWIARLGYVDHWQGTRILDSSAFCLRVGETSDEVEFLCRATRLQLVFDDGRIQSSDGYIMNCHVAVHVAIDLPASDNERLNRLFDRVPQFKPLLRSVASGTLRHEFSTRPYRQSMYQAPVIVAALNRCWAENAQFRDYWELLQVEFTALIIRPREEAERRFLATPTANLEHVHDRIRILDQEVETRRSDRERRWQDWQLSQSAALQALEEQVAESILRAADGLRRQMPAITNQTQLLTAVDAMFQTGGEQLESRCHAVSDALDGLARFMEEIRLDGDSLMERIRAERIPRSETAETQTNGVGDLSAGARLDDGTTGAAKICCPGRDTP
jgi:hypothetical protein